MLHHVYERLFVIHHENSLPVALEWFVHRRRRRGFAHRGSWQENGKGRALARVAGDRDLTTVVLDDPMDHRKSEPGAFAHGLGGEERLEDAFDHGSLHAMPGVGDIQP